MAAETERDWYEVPIGQRVERFLAEHGTRCHWFSAGGIAVRAHMPEWMVLQQLTALHTAGRLDISEERGTLLYTLA